MFDHLDDEALRERVVAVRRELTRLEAEWVALAGELDRRRAWASDGSLSGGAWLARHCDLAGSTAREKLRVATKLRSMPRTAAAFADGALGWSHVRVLASAVNERTADAFARDEALLVEHAAALDADRFALLVRRWQAMVDQDGPTPAAHDLARNGAQLSQTFRGRWAGRLDLDAESGAIVAGVLERVMDELRRAEAPGDAVASPRTAAQRRAEALVEVFRRAAAVRDDGEPARPLVVVTLDLAAAAAGAGLSARLPDGTPVTGEAARRLACDAGVVRVLTDGASMPLDLGRTTRTPTRAQRRALATRFDTCAYPGCTRPFRWCELHHVHHWLDGGPTDLDNLVPFCSRHHHLHHEGSFRLARGPDGRLHVHDGDGRVVGEVRPAAEERQLPLRDVA